ncbi:MAG TPA: amino acid adenylation domain-containing protein, partial [Candidatus Angelobacter sp.]
MDARIEFQEYALNNTGASSVAVAATESPSSACIFPLSVGQKQLWLLQQLDPYSAAYNTILYLRLAGRLDRQALERSFSEIVRRHEILRTTFPLWEREPAQQIHPALAVTLPLIDLSGLEVSLQNKVARSLRQREAQRPFDLAAGPLLRVSLIGLGSQQHELLITMHHIVRDGWSKDILLEELRILYDAYHRRKASPLSELPIQYADYAVWQQRWLQNGSFENRYAYWYKQLADLPALDLPIDCPRPQVAGHPAEEVSFCFSNGLSDRLRRLGQQEGATLFMVLLAGFQWLLGLHAGQNNIAVGTAVTNRNRRELERLIGFFVNTLVIRTDLGGVSSFRELIRRVRQVVLAAYSHDVPFEKLVEKLNPTRVPGRTPFFQAMFSLQNAETDAVELGNLNAEGIDDFKFQETKFELLLQMESGEDSLAGELQYAADTYSRQTMQRLVRHYELFLEQAVAKPDVPLLEIPLLTQGEMELIVFEWNNTDREYPQEKCVHEIFEEQVRQSPDAVAVGFGTERQTYSELNQKANQIARYLRSLGVAAETRVALCLERGMRMVESVLGILKAGGAYVPLDLGLPPERLEYMLRDIQPDVLLTEEKFKRQMEHSAAQIVCLEAVKRQIVEQSNENLSCRNSGDNLAYVMYTSGSTGRPKGIMICHRAISRLVLNTNYVDLKAGDVFLQFAPTSFDAATFEIWGCLLNGGLLVIPKGGRASVEELGEQIQKHQVSVLWLTAGLFHQVVEQVLDKLKGVKQLLSGGDVLSAAHVRRVGEKSKATQLINGYGPTENTTFSCCYRMTPEEMASLGESVPIGTPINSTRAYVLDQQMNPVPLGIRGELYLGGDGLARGYWKAPALTAERFVPDPFRGGGERLYRTGDQVRWRNDGKLEFLGRLDHQIKLRGYRIELGEIEAALCQHAGVEQAVVMVREDHNREKQLVG